MRTRLYTLYPRKDHTSDTTVVIDLDVTDPISSIVIGLETTNAAATMTAHPLACLTKIEIVDGSDVLHSLDGYEADAKDWYDRGGRFRNNYNYCLNGGGNCRYLGLNFGRFPFDPLFAFDPKKFTNPQLRVSLDIDAGGSSTATLYLTVWANLFDEKVISPQGFFMTKEVKSYSISSSVHEYTDLPLDYPYRNIYFRPFVAGTEPNQVVSNFKLVEDYGKRIPYDHGVQDIERCINAKYPLVEEHLYFADDTSNRYLYVSPTTIVAGFIIPWKASGPSGTHSFYDGDGGKAKIIASTAGENIQVYVRGAIPHCVYKIPVCDDQDPADFWNVSGLRNLKADITGANTATGYLFVEQVRSY